MIELHIEEYCHECRAFSPVTEIKETKSLLNPFNGTIEPGIVRTTIKCENAKRCAGIARYIRNELIKEREN